MKDLLRYLLIIQPGGLPLFAQSLNFQTDFECQTFNNRLGEIEVNSVLVGGLFQAIKDLFSELINDHLKLINISFLSYRVTGLVFDKFLFVGIFEIPNQDDSFSKVELFPYLREIAQEFTTKFPDVLDETDKIDISMYEGFSADLIKMGFSLSLQDCRNCLTKCVEENKECLPHIFYYKELIQT